MRPGPTWPVFRTLGLSAFVAAVVNAIVAATPSIGHELGLSITQSQAIALGYLVPFAVLLLATGSLIERWGQHTALHGRARTVGTAVWTAAPVYDNAAHNAGWGTQ